VTFRRLAAIALIFIGSSVGWVVLGSSLLARTGQFDGRLEKEVRLLWGAPQRQTAPRASVVRPGIETQVVETKEADGRILRQRVNKLVSQTSPLALDSSRVSVDLDLEHRRRGLLWYATYSVAFKGTYVFKNPDAQKREIRLHFPLPAENALFDDFVFVVNGRPAVTGGDMSKEMAAGVDAEPDAPITLDVQYRSRGLKSWTYLFGESGISHVRDFVLTMRTNFKDIDFPAGSISPHDKSETPSGWSLVWRFTNLISGQSIAMELPEKLNPGPFAARVTFFAPVSLLFFLAAMVMIGVISGPPLHPMHYWFLAAAFFAFHLLLAYLVDHIAVSVAFALSAAVSVGLVFSYLRLITGTRQALLRAGSAQLVFLVLFSYAFFFEGFTGLTITIGAIVTLFVMMQMTARVSWDELFARKTGASAATGSLETGHAGR
jgi:hypothetical protein